MGRRNQKNQPLDQTGPATTYPNQRGGYADDYEDQTDNQRQRLDARHDWAEGTGNYGQQTRTNVSYRHGTIRP